MKPVKAMLRSLRDFYLRTPTLIAYMLQSTEYDVPPYLRWYWRTQNFSSVMHRRRLEPTRRARLLRWMLRLGVAVQLAAGVCLIILGITRENWAGSAAFGAALVVSYPLVWAHLVVIPLLLVKWLVVEPRNKVQLADTEEIFAGHAGVKIAVLGSYGKTTMKELLATVLGSARKVAATPGNKNVSLSHAAFARSLKGDEEVLFIEYGEGQPGDIARFARHTHPTHAVITGVAAAHLDKYGTVERAAQDIFSIGDFVAAQNIFANQEAPAAREFIRPEFHAYDRSGVRGGAGKWKVADAAVGLEDTTFTLKNGKQHMHVRSGLLGRHQIGPLAAAAVLALQLGLKPAEIEKGMAETRPFEHRLQPYRLGGAWIIDDTYNGNLEGIRAGTELLAELPATRKWYVTPGLVDQGADTAAIHQEVGRLIAAAKPDIVVLMKNSATDDIRAGLEAGTYGGDLRIESDPLNFYTSLEHFVAAGDLVLMQNDWTDNYA